MNGEAVDSLPVYKRARGGISRSFQQLELFESSTVRENLMVASDGYSHVPYATDIVRPTNPPLSSTAVAAVKELELGQYLDVRVSDLPYGRRRLVAIARAIAVAPSILLLDEPAAGLGDTETAELATVVRRLAKEWGLGILVIEHDMSFVMSVCDRITVLDFGSQIATGTPAEVRADPAVIAAYLGEGGDEEHAVCPAPSRRCSRTHPEVSHERRAARRRGRLGRLPRPPDRARPQPDGAGRARSSSCSARTAPARRRRS